MYLGVSTKVECLHLSISTVVFFSAGYTYTTVCNCTQDEYLCEKKISSETNIQFDWQKMILQLFLKTLFVTFFKQKCQTFFCFFLSPSVMICCFLSFVSCICRFRGTKRQFEALRNCNGISHQD